MFVQYVTTYYNSCIEKWEFYGEKRGLRVYIAMKNEELVGVRFVDTSMWRFTAAAYSITGIGLLFLPFDKYHMAAVILLFTGCAPLVAQIYKSNITSKIDDLAVEKSDSLTPSLRLIAGGFFKF